MLTFKDVTKDEHLVSPKQPKYKRGFHPNSRKNLLGPRWQKGQSGNPIGYSLTSALKDALRKPLKEPPPDAHHGDVIVYNTLKGAAELVPIAFRETWDRVEGLLQDTPPPPQGNRIIQIIVSSEKAGELTENVGRRLLPKGEAATEK